MPYVFAYGSNMNPQQMRARCPSAAFVSVTFLKNYRFDFGGWSGRWRGGVATINPNPGCVVPGVLYKLSLDDLQMLDAFEGCPSYYGRIQVMTSVRVRAFAYRLVNPVLHVPPGVQYVQTIAGAYKFWGLRNQAKVLYDAVRRCRYNT